MATSNASGPVIWDVDSRGVANLVLNRPELNNAYDGDLIEGLLAASDALARVDGLRVIVVKGNGRHFQAGADLKWIDAVRTASPQENIRVSRAGADGRPGAGRLLRRRHRNRGGLRRRDRGRQCALLDFRSPLGTDGRHHHPAAQ
jgi:enoyl-CoA hydratase/carnithine racemase